MNYARGHQSLIIQGNTAEDFQEKLNKALEEVAMKGYKHELTFNMNAGFCAYIVYDVTYTKAESLADEYELRGETFRCYECPMFRPSADRRVKYTTCGRGVHKCSANDNACEWFYEAMERGEIVPNEEGRTAEEDIG